MNGIFRKIWALVSVALTLGAGSLPGCATMGGGGMHYSADPPGFSAQGTST